MKRLFLLYLATFFIIISFSQPSHAFLPFLSSEAERFDKRIETAQRAHELGHVENSKEELAKVRQEMNERMSANLGKYMEDFDFQFVLAKCEFLENCLIGGRQNCQSDAHRKFLLLARNSSKHKDRIFNFYAQQSQRYAQVNDNVRSLELIVAAYQDFQPDRARVKRAAAEMYDNGRLAAQDSNAGQAAIYFWAALALDPDLQTKITTDIINAVQKAPNPNNGLAVLNLLYRFSTRDSWPEANQTAVQLISVNKPGTADQAKQRFPELRQFPDQAQQAIYALAYPPDFIVYRPGQIKVFELKAGEESDHFVRINDGVKIKFQIKHGDFNVVTRSGKVYEIKSIPPYMPEDFKIRAPVDTDMRLVFN